MIGPIVSGVLALIGLNWIAHLRKQGLGNVARSHFWYLSLIWLVAFPIRAYWIDHDLIDIQVPHHWTPAALCLSLFVATVSWSAAYFGYLSPIECPKIGDAPNRSGLWVSRLTLIAATTTAVIFSYTLVSALGWHPFRGNEQNLARVGEGPWFLMAELFIFAGIAHIAYFSHPMTRPSLWVDGPLLLVAFGLASLMTMLLNSRRYVAYFVFASLVALSARFPRKRLFAWLTLGVVLSTVGLASVLEVVRREIDIPLLLQGRAAEIDMSFTHLRYNLTAISSSFEGVDHLAKLLDVAVPKELAAGVDAGETLLYNVGLGLVPRRFWPSKPIIYGSTYQQYFLYPEMYVRQDATVTFPVGYVADFIFCFGIVGMMALSFFLGRALALCERVFQDPKSAFTARAFSLYLFLNIFNVFRSGIGLISTLLTYLALLLPSILAFGEGKVLWMMVRSVFTLPRRSLQDESH